MRRPAALLAALIAAVLVLPWLPPVRTAVLTVALVPELLGTPIRPLSVLPEPRLITTTYGTPADRLDVYLPAGAAPGSRLPAVVLELGVHPEPIDHPDIVGVATAIGRLGVVVGVPDSNALRNLQITPAEPAHLVDALLTIATRPEVDPARVGLAGFSAGASIALVAAADPRIADSLPWISAFGGYADAELLLVDVASRTTLSDGQAVAWRPDPGIRRDVLELSLATLGTAAERDRLRQLLSPIVAADDPPHGPSDDALVQLSGDARAMYLLFTAADRASAEQAIATLSRLLRQQLAGISPLTVADGIRAPVFLLHGQPDTAIPVAHAGLLARAIGPEVARLTVFGQFGHAQPGQGGLDIDDAGDVWELSLYLRDIVAAALE